MLSGVYSRRSCIVKLDGVIEGVIVDEMVFVLEMVLVEDAVEDFVGVTVAVCENAIANHDTL
jgi:hypothetical protein